MRITPYSLSGLAASDDDLYITKIQSELAELERRQRRRRWRRASARDLGPNEPCCDVAAVCSSPYKRTAAGPRVAPRNNVL